MTPYRALAAAARGPWPFYVFMSLLIFTGWTARVSTYVLLIVVLLAIVAGLLAQYVGQAVKPRPPSNPPSTSQHSLRRSFANESLEDLEKEVENTPIRELTNLFETSSIHLDEFLDEAEEMDS